MTLRLDRMRTMRWWHFLVPLLFVLELGALPEVLRVWRHQLSSGCLRVRDEGAQGGHEGPRNSRDTKTTPQHPLRSLRHVNPVSPQSHSCALAFFSKRSANTRGSFTCF